VFVRHIGEQGKLSASLVFDKKSRAALVEEAEPATVKGCETLTRQVKNNMQSRRPVCAGRQTDRVQKE
jgi:hypothetical protein